MKNLPEQALEEIANYFQVFAEPTRLKILNLLREREYNVGSLAELSGYSIANISRHLALLAQNGIVARETRGVSAFYRIADPSIYAMCELVCDNIAKRYQQSAAEHFKIKNPPHRPSKKKASEKA